MADAANNRHAKRWLTGGLALLALGGFVAFRLEQRAELSPVARGERLATSAGCYACHGRSETDLRRNRRPVAGGAWRSKAIPTFWENGIDRADVLIDWIANGVPEAEREAHRQLFVQMPAYRKVLDAGEIEAIATWILAEGLRLAQGDGSALAGGENFAAADVVTWSPDRLLAAGDRLSRKHGCYTCHGELGQGGVANLASFKGYIPGFFGEDFRALTESGQRDEVRHWIDHGRGKSVESGLTGGLAKYFFDRQAIGMPAYREQLAEPEKAVLVEYLLWLNRQGPLTAKNLEHIARVLNEEASPKS